VVVAFSALDCLLRVQALNVRFGILAFSEDQCGTSTD
jgi:hypothetical protein